MTPRRFRPSEPPRSDLPLGGEAWVALWRSLWFDLPLLWADEIDRFLFSRVPPLTDGRG